MPIEIKGVVRDLKTSKPISGAEVRCYEHKGKECAETHSHVTYTNGTGAFSFSNVADGSWTVEAAAFGDTARGPVPAGCNEMRLTLNVSPKIQAKLYRIKECGTPEECLAPIPRQVYQLDLSPFEGLASASWSSNSARITPLSADGLSAQFEAARPGDHGYNVGIKGPQWPGGGGIAPGFDAGFKQNVRPGSGPGITRVALQRSAIRPTTEEDLWTVIRTNTRGIGFESYRSFIDTVLCHRENLSGDLFPSYANDSRRFQRERTELTALHGVGAYDLLRTATELFLLLNCRTQNVKALSVEDLADEEARRNQPGTLGDLSKLAQSVLGNNGYIRNVIDTAFAGLEVRELGFCDGVLTHRTEPCLIELIWSYWHEEGMLCQSVGALSRRFQNLHAPGSRDPLAHFELDPLRPLNNILWGYVQEENRRLTVPRRSLEYRHHYGLALYGKANPGSPAADPRSKFLESFHNLLHRCSQFFREDSDTTVIADGFPLLNALREVHLILAQGAHNQFGDLPWTARVEMLMQQWIMARQEIRDFLQSRAMVPATEAWMPQVDTMKTVQTWTDVGSGHFHDLAIYGEQLLLSVRYGNWIDINDEDVAKNWARYWRPEIQSYLHSYRSVAGIDLTNPDTVDFAMPAVHLKRRLDAQIQSR